MTKKQIIHNIHEYASAILDMCNDWLKETDPEEREQIEAFLRTDSSSLQGYAEDLQWIK